MRHWLQTFSHSLSQRFPRDKTHKRNSVHCDTLNNLILFRGQTLGILEGKAPSNTKQNSRFLVSEVSSDKRGMCGTLAEDIAIACQSSMSFLYLTVKHTPTEKQSKTWQFCESGRVFVIYMAVEQCAVPWWNLLPVSQSTPDPSLSLPLPQTLILSLCQCLLCLLPSTSF